MNMDTSGRPKGAAATAELVLSGLDYSTSMAELDAAAKDWWPISGKWTEEEAAVHRPIAVVWARSEDDLVKAVKAASSSKLPVIARGAGSGVVGGVIGNGGHLSLDLSRMKRVVRVGEDRREVVVEPGKLAGELEEELNAKGLTLGHYPQSLYLASVGGLVATRSSGTFSNKYGGIENLVTGLRVVMADGSTTEFRSVPRSATGPYLLPMFIGSEGALGIISQVTLRVFPLPETREFGGFTFRTFSSAVEAVKECYRRHAVPAVLRIYDEIEAQSLYRRVGIEEDLPLLIVGHDGASAIVEAERKVMREVAEQHGGRWIGNAIGDAWEKHRFHAQWLVDGNDGPGKMADAIEIAAAWPDIVPLFDEVKEKVSSLCTVLMAHMSHFYSTGGAIYFIFTVEDTSSEAARARYAKIWEDILRITLKHGGAISHHHGVGSIRADLLAEDLGSAHRLLQVVKTALDPAGILNPGKLGLVSRQTGTEA